MLRGALETRLLRMEFGHAGSFHVQMRGMRVQVHRHKPVKVFCFLVERFIASNRGLKYASRGS